MEQHDTVNTLDTERLKGKTATEKQINYANILARQNNVDVPVNGDRYDYFRFIEKYAPKKQKSQNERKYYPRKKGTVTLTEREWDINYLKGKCGVYAFFGKKRELLYVGKSYNLASRIPTSFNERSMQQKITRIKCYVCDTKSDANILEMMLISENQPPLNSDGKTGDKPILFMSGFDAYNDFDDVPFPKETKIEAYPAEMVVKSS